MTYALTTSTTYIVVQLSERALFYFVGALRMFFDMVSYMRL